MLIKYSSYFNLWSPGLLQWKKKNPPFSLNFFVSFSFLRLSPCLAFPHALSTLLSVDLILQQEISGNRFSASVQATILKAFPFRFWHALKESIYLFSQLRQSPSTAQHSPHPQLPLQQHTWFLVPSGIYHSPTRSRVLRHRLCHEAH